MKPKPGFLGVVCDRTGSDITEEDGLAQNFPNPFN